MKNSLLFKSLIDILFVLHVLGLFAILLRFPLGVVDVVNMEPLNLWKWIILTISCLIYLIFLRGLFFLRKIAREFLLNKMFTESVAISMKKSGSQFTYAGIISLLIFLSKRLFDLNFEFIPQSVSITPIFLIIVGLFLTIQSKILLKTISIKNENDLTI